MSDIQNSQKHPSGLWYTAVTTIFVTFAYGMVNSLLVLYLINHLQYSQHQAYAIYAAFNALVFTLPIASGVIGSRLGYKPSMSMGLLFTSIGALSLTFASHLFLFIGLATLAMGIATCTTCAACIIGICYKKQDKRRESGFTLFYIIFNIGFLTSVASGGFLVRAFDYQSAFTLAGILAALSLIFFLFIQKRIKAHPERSFKPIHIFPRAIVGTLLITSYIIITGLAALLLKYVDLANIALWAMVIVFTSIVIIIALRQKTKIARQKLFAFLILCIISIAFWSLYMLEPSMLTLFIEKNVNRHIGHSTIPASIYYSLDALYVLCFGFLLSIVWKRLAHVGKNPSLPTKFSSSLISMGLGYWTFALSILLVGSTHLVNMSWVFGGYMFLAFAELLISPIGLSMVGRLSPPKFEGLLMGMWQLYIGFSAIISGYLADLAIVPKHGLPMETNPIFMHAMFKIGLMTIVIGILSALFIPKIKRLIRQHDNQPEAISNGDDASKNSDSHSH